MLFRSAATYHVRSADFAGDANHVGDDRGDVVRETGDGDGVCSWRWRGVRRKLDVGLQVGDVDGREARSCLPDD